ncbi:MAG: ABC transporter ATP-binding protein [Lachnospiraceae bacterium]|nr:ABC transporter ATP-binding protein [Lachnospiraceae bacterium]
MDGLKNNEIVLEVRGLYKKYGNNLVVNNASFQLERGKIYGFIGQNGAGKTTIIRMLAGYARPNAGEISIFGDSTVKGLSDGRKRMGLIVENPSLYTKMSAYDNIEIQKMLYGIKNDGLAEELLTLVGLAGVGKRPVKNFSLGMRQRLGIAMALVNNPEILVLDEPINGLDPMGIVEVRELLLKLNRERNLTILISSHILSELYQLASDYIIINQGQIVEKMTLEELDSKCSNYIIMQPEDMPAALSLLNRMGITEIENGGNGFIRFRNNDNNNVRAIAQACLNEKILLTHFSVQAESLENYFVKLVGGANNGQAF